MQTAAALIIALLASPVGVLASTEGHPVEKVIGLLQGLAAKAESEGKQEELSYEKFAYWCKNSLKSLSASIADETSTIESLEDKVEAGEQQQKQLEDEIAALEVQLGELATSTLKATSAREAGKGLYDETNSDLTLTIEAVAAAIAALEGSKDASFVQVLANPKVQMGLALAEAAAPEGAQRRAIAGLLQQPAFKGRPEFEASGDEAAHVQKYDFKSGDVIETFKTLKTRFDDELLAATKAETNAINAHKLAEEEREHVIAASTASKAEKTSVLADVEADLATFRSQLASEQSDKAADEATRDETDKACLVKKQEWEQRSSVRTGEIEAIGAAVKILSSATGVRTEAPGNPVPPPGVVLAQGGVALLQVDDPRQKALNLLRSTARRTHSKALERLAQELSAHLDDPFQVVVNSIEKMIFHLQNEQRQEDEHKAWCDQELSHNHASKQNKEEKIADLTTKIDSANALTQELAYDIAAAETHIAQIGAFVKEATEIRAIGKKENAISIADAQQAQQAIADATAVLEAFYKESGEVSKAAWEALVQQPVQLPTKPDTWGSSYTGVADPVNQPAGIITVLKQVGSEFATMEADTRAQEAADQEVFEQDIKDNKIAQAQREQEVHTKSAEHSRQVGIAASLTAAKKHTSDELETVDRYLKDLEPACVNGDSTYEDRKAARTEETDALRQAQGILDDAFKAPAAASLAAASTNRLRHAAVKRHA